MRKFNEPPLPLERILTVSARDYCESQGKELNAYKMFGIHSRCIDSGERNFDPLVSFLDKIPSDTEVIVDYHSRTGVSSEGGVGSSTLIYSSGTALIPKTLKAVS